jgi:hypothetical protein
VLQIYKYDTPSGGSSNYREEHISLQALSKSFISNGLSYTFDRLTLLEVYSETGLIKTLKRDTITTEYADDSHFNLLPGTYLGDHESNLEPYCTQGVFNGRETKCKRADILYDYVGSSCLNLSYTEACITCAEYIKGLGGGYYNCQGQEGDKHIYELIYYQKGSEEWGTPFDFTVSTKEVSTEFGFKYYPNPADKTVLIQAPQSGRYDIVILNIQGQMLLRETQGQTTSEIDVSKLSPGMYFIQIIFESDLVYIKPLIIQH